MQKHVFNQSNQGDPTRVHQARKEIVFLNNKTVEITPKGLATEEATFGAHVDSRGRIIVPKEVRDTLGIGDTILLRCTIRKVALTEGENSRKGKRDG
jgi:AbrB family looped-hinge helix DNA binding protein